MKIDHDTEELYEAFGLTKRRVKELSVLASMLHNKVDRDSRFIESLWKSKKMTEAEKIFLIYTCGKMDGSKGNTVENMVPVALMAGVAAHAALAMFLGSIRVWGLEQALDRVRASVGEEDANMVSYEKCLKAVELIRDKVKNHETERE